MGRRRPTPRAGHARAGSGLGRVVPGKSSMRSSRYDGTLSLRMQWRFTQPKDRCETRRATLSHASEAPNDD